MENSPLFFLEDMCSGALVELLGPTMACPEPGTRGRTPGEATLLVGPDLSNGTYGNGRPVRDSLRVLKIPKCHLSHYLLLLLKSFLSQQSYHCYLPPSRNQRLVTNQSMRGDVSLQSTSKAADSLTRIHFRTRGTFISHSLYFFSNRIDWYSWVTVKLQITIPLL